MEGEITANTVLDYAVFRISSNKNRYGALVCSKGNREKLASGPLDQLTLHLPEAKRCQSKSSSHSFQLQPVESLKGSSWFTKSTLGRFLHIVNSPEMLKSVNAIENEMSQLEDTRRFHLSLYVKGHPDHPGSQTAVSSVLTAGCLDEVGPTQTINVETMSSDATKNELLRAIDVRFAVLKEELAASFDQAAGATLSTKQISDLEAFAHHFQAVDLRNSLLKYLAIIPNDQLAEPTVEQITHSEDTTNNCEDITEAICQPSQQMDITKPFSDGASPAKLAQAERRTSTESEESSDSSDEDQTCVERSRPLIRSASPRRSASPMRRIQIGRSGSRRSTALTIKSLSYFPVRERIPFNRDADRNSSEDESDQPHKKSDSTVRRMSVQDAINLFESKQKDQNLDIQRRASGVSISTNKSVLRRWSEGMDNSFNHSSQQSATNTGSENTSMDLAPEAEERKLTEVKAGSNFPGSLNPDENAQDREPLEVVKMASPPKNNPFDLVKSQAEEISDRAAASAEWNQHKEAELNHMLMKMMESKPERYQETATCTVGYQDVACEQRGGLCCQYKEKKDEELRAENAGRGAAKESQFKVMQETLERSKAAMASKAGGMIGKHDSSGNTQRPRRNLSPPVLVKKEVSKSGGPRKASPKSSPLPTSRNSWSSASSMKANVSQPIKTSPRMTPSNATPNRRKPQSTPLQTQPSPRMERLVQKGRKGSPADAKPIMKSQEEKKKAMTKASKVAITKASKVAKTRSSEATGDVSRAISAKPSFYNKVTKKSSVVPLESKPFLRKGTGIGPGTGSVKVKTKVSVSDDSAKNSGNLTQTEDKESARLTDESTTKVLEVDLAQPANDVAASLENSLHNDLILEKTENSNQILAVLDNGSQEPVEPPAPEVQPDEDMGISSAAWVEVEHQEVSAECDNGMSEISASPGIAPAAASSLRVHHSLSQMLQADNGEPEIIEWGNAENPPAFVYQKDAPKGLKRLLKFARKSKEANVTGWASPPIFSEGEDDPEESKAANKKNLDSLSRKAGLGKGNGQQKTMLGESLDGGNSSRRAADFLGMHDLLSAQSSTRSFTSLGSDKLREGHVPVTATSTKASRSFFSLSTFRSSKSSETKPR